MIHNTTLKVLDLSDNYFDDITIIANMIRINKSIISLNLSNINMNRNEIDKIIEGMIYNNNIKQISLDQEDFKMTEMSPTSINKLDEKIKKNIIFFNKMTWRYPMNIISFGGKTFRDIIITIILCNTQSIIVLPLELLLYIFEFFPRELFLQESFPQ